MQIHNLTKYYADQLVFAGVSATISPGDHIGLVGANGVGKTTLLRILTGEVLLDHGDILKPPNYRIGYLQQLLPDGVLTLEQYLSQPFAGLMEVERQIRQLERELAKSSADQASVQLDAAMRQYADLQQRWEMEGGYTYHARINSVVLGLGLALVDLAKPLTALSGGQRVRAQLARLLLEEPDLLLLDEPSNHLDLEALEWLEDFLQKYPKAIIVVSHDRYFLDRFATKIWELADHRLYEFKGSFSAYQTQREQRLSQARIQARKQQEEIARIEEFVRRFGAGTRAAQAKSRARKLEKLKPITVGPEPETMEFQFKPRRASGIKVVEFDDVTKAYDRVVLDHVSGAIRHGDRIALLGANGSGKSTLLKILAGRLDCTGEIKWGVNVDVGYFGQELEFEHNQSVLHELYLTYDLDYGQLRSVLARFLFRGEQVFQPVNVLSGGERNRLLLAKLFLAAPNFLLLDEPTNHLDIYARTAVAQALGGYTGTMLFVTHDRYLVDLLATKIWILDGGRITEFAGNYSQYREYLKARQDQVQRQEQKAKQPAAGAKSKPRQTGTGFKRQQQQLEMEIISCEEKKAELEELLSRPELYQDPEKIKQTNQEYHALMAKLEACYQQWEKLIDAIQAKDDG